MCVKPCPLGVYSPRKFLKFTCSKVGLLGPPKPGIELLRLNVSVQILRGEGGSQPHMKTLIKPDYMAHHRVFRLS